MGVEEGRRKKKKGERRRKEETKGLATTYKVTLIRLKCVNKTKNHTSRYRQMK